MGIEHAALLRNGGYDVDFVNPSKTGGDWPQPLKWLALPVRLARYVPLLVRIRCGRYDVIHIHFLSHGLIGVAGGRDFFVHAHGYVAYLQLSSRVEGPLNRLVLRHAKKVFYVTSDLEPFLADFAAKAQLLPNPVADQFLAPAQPPSSISKILIYLRLDPIKGVEEIFDAAPRLAELVSLDAIATGSLLGKLQIEYGRVVHFRPPVHHSEARSLLEGFDAVIGQMRLGALGLSELEALAMGRVVLMRLNRKFYPGDPPPVVEVNGADDLVSEVKRLQSSPDEVRRLSRAGTEWVRRHHSGAAFVRALRAAYGV